MWWDESVPAVKEEEAFPVPTWRWGVGVGIRNLPSERAWQQGGQV
jgi:hypothetical protein